MPGIKSLIQIASLAQDMFYQDYAPRDAFFSIDDFKKLCIATYSKLINDGVNSEKYKNKSTEGFSSVEIPVDWLIEEVVSIEKVKNQRIATTQYDIFSFDYDAFAIGLQYVEKVDGPCDKFIKISPMDAWSMDTLPYTTNVYYYKKSSNKIYFIERHCVPEKVLLRYIPAMDMSDDSSVMSESLVMPVITTVLQLMFGAKSGNIIDMSDDSNLNSPLPGQVNPDIKKQT